MNTFTCQVAQDIPWFLASNPQKTLPAEIKIVNMSIIYIYKLKMFFVLSFFLNRAKSRDSLYLICLFDPLYLCSLELLFQLVGIHLHVRRQSLGEQR